MIVPMRFRWFGLGLNRGTRKFATWKGRTEIRNNYSHSMSYPSTRIETARESSSADTIRL